MNSLVKCIVAALAVGSFTCPSRANERVYQQVLRSTVCIFADQKSGTGVLIDADRRLVVTNYHVVQGCPAVNVVFTHFEEGKLTTDRRFYLDHLKQYGIKAKVTVCDPRRDLALVELESLPDKRPALPLAAESAQAGQQVHSIGNPSASSALWVYTSGTVRQVYAKTIRLIQGFSVNATVVETQSPVNPGDSGGPLVNDDGKLVAVNESTVLNAVLISDSIDVSELKQLLKGSNKTVDPRVQKLASSLGFPYTVLPTGGIRFDFKEKDFAQAVFIETPRKHGTEPETFKITAPYSRTAEPLASELANLLLDQSGHFALGAWETFNVGSQKALTYRIKLPADAPTELVRYAIDVCRAAVRETHPKYQAALLALKAKNGAPSWTLDGNWIVYEKEASQSESATRLTFSGTSFVLHAGILLEVRGTYRVADDLLTLTVGNNTLRKGKLRWMTSEKFTLEAAGKMVEFRKAVVPEAVTAAPAV
jgi:hypothetical protein